MKKESSANTDKDSIDPITLAVIRHGLVSITDQIDANITRTALSPYIYEYKDFAVGLVGADGELIAQCTGGMLVFVDGGPRPEYLPWSDVERIDFDRPPAMYPPSSGRR